ncbi:MAG: VWA domain-containing protein [Oligoflexales bacterium]|nr:VWA domain-containing protein [Oligoflexales bacterium]
MNPFLNTLKLSFLIVSLCHCVPTKFAPTGSVQKGNPGGKSLYTITCQAEKAQRQDIALPLSASSYEYRVFPFCDQHIEDTSQENRTKPLNIVIVLDRTSSMGATINAVKSGIVQFADGLEDSGWDVIFAAIGFRDYINDFLITPFTDATSIKSSMDSWKAEGGQDYQEAGMQAISTAYELLRYYKRQKPARKDAVDVVLYASDGVAYAGQRKNDFSTDALSAKTLKLLSGELPKLKFYYSVPNDLDPLKEYGLNAPSPKAQMEEFTTTSRVPGKPISFPLNREILNEFSKEFVEVTLTKAHICQATSASFNSAITTGVPSRSQRDDILKQLKNGEPLVFTASPDPTITDYTLTINRCCKLADDEQATECQFTQTSKLGIKFKKK